MIPRSAGGIRPVAIGVFDGPSSLSAMILGGESPCSGWEAGRLSGPAERADGCRIGPNMKARASRQHRREPVQGRPRDRHAEVDDQADGVGNSSGGVRPLCLPRPAGVQALDLPADPSRSGVRPGGRPRRGSRSAPPRAPRRGGAPPPGPRPGSVRDELLTRPDPGQVLVGIRARPGEAEAQGLGRAPGGGPGGRGLDRLGVDPLPGDDPRRRPPPAGRPRRSGTAGRRTGCGTSHVSSVGTRTVVIDRPPREDSDCIQLV